MICSKCSKRLSRKTARQIDGEVMCSGCMFGHSAIVPLVPTEAMWGGLARQIVMWLSFPQPTPLTLFNHLRRSGWEVPQWLRDEPEMKFLDHVPSKGTRAAIIYRAMVEAAPAIADTHPEGGDGEAGSVGTMGGAVTAEGWQSPNPSSPSSSNTPNPQGEERT